MLYRVYNVKRRVCELSARQRIGGGYIVYSGVGRQGGDHDVMQICISVCMCDKTMNDT